MKTDEEILVERAGLISGHRVIRNEPSGSELTLVEFSLLPERYAVEEHFVREVLILKELTPLPGVPAFVAGITNMRGRIISVLNLKILLGIRTVGLTELNRIILLKNDKMEFGILTDAVLGIRTLGIGLVNPPPVNLQGILADSVKGITAEGLILLNCERILMSSEIIINQK